MTTAIFVSRVFEGSFCVNIFIRAAVDITDSPVTLLSLGEVGLDVSVNIFLRHSMTEQFLWNTQLIFCFSSTYGLEDVFVNSFLTFHVKSCNTNNLFVLYVEEVKK